MDKMELNDLISFYKGKKVFLTGHTGFKGSWMCCVLKRLGATVIGYSLDPITKPSLYEILNLENMVDSNIGDINDLENLKQIMKKVNPDIVIHMAAQPLVRESYVDPVGTYATNVMGTIHVLESARYCSNIKSIVNVTTDKVYKNNEWEWGYRENEELNGYDPYSNSKSCSELVTSSYIKSFFMELDVAISTCRAGNVIGGGDFSKDRIIPDCVEAANNNKNIVVRNPLSIRPYQHVLEPVIAYLIIAYKQYNNKDKYSSEYNIGPRNEDSVYTKDLVEIFCDAWGENTTWVKEEKGNAVHEANFLKLDCSKIKNTMGWYPVWNVKTAVVETVNWSKKYYNQKSEILDFTNKQIEKYLSEYFI